MVKLPISIISGILIVTALSGVAWVTPDNDIDENTGGQLLNRINRGTGTAERIFVTRAETARRTPVSTIIQETENTTAPVPEESTATTSPGEDTSLKTPLPPAEPPPPPFVPEAALKAMGWWLIGGIIVVLALIGLAIYFLVIKQSRYQ